MFCFYPGLIIGGLILKVLIVGGGPVHLPQLERELMAKPDLVIAVDYGGSYFDEMGILPQVLLGDFDSLSKTVLSQMAASDVEIISFPTHKDYTDLELALDFALTKEPEEIRILGGLGNRLDHTLGNIGMLVKPLSKGVKAHLLDEFHDIFLISDFIRIRNNPGWAISLIPLSQKVTGVTTTGLLYPLTNAELYLDSGRGLHNEFTEETASIKVHEGTLIIVCFQEAQ